MTTKTKMLLVPWSGLRVKKGNQRRTTLYLVTLTFAISCCSRFLLAARTTKPCRQDLIKPEIVAACLDPNKYYTKIALDSSRARYKPIDPVNIKCTERSALHMLLSSNESDGWPFEQEAKILIDTFGANVNQQCVVYETPLSMFERRIRSNAPCNRPKSDDDILEADSAYYTRINTLRDGILAADAKQPRLPEPTIVDYPGPSGERQPLPLASDLVSLRQVVRSLDDLVERLGRHAPPK